MVSNRPNQVTLKVTSYAAHFLVLDKFAFADSISDIAKQRVMKIVEFLEKIPAFGSLNKIALENLCKNLRRKKICHNQVIYNEGEPVQNVYIIKKGEFEL